MGGPGMTNLFQIPWPDESGSYRLKTVEIESYDNPDNLQGSYAKVLVDPYISGGRLESSTPVGRYVKTNGNVMVPADFVSLQAAAIHAHFERLRKLDNEAGFGQSAGWPTTVGVQANVVDRRGSVRNNAMFDAKLDALLIVPYLNSKLPIAVNAGILAHEHFHQIFQTLVLDPIGEGGPRADKPASLAPKHLCNWEAKSAAARTLEGRRGGMREAKIPPALYNRYLLRSINEGLADFWAWVYTGDAEFIRHSLPEFNELRRLDEDVKQIPGTESVKWNLRNPRDGSLVSEEAVFELSYSLGTYYSRFLRELADHVSEASSRSKSARESRLEVAQALIKALPGLSAEADRVAKAGGYLSPYAILKPLYQEIGKADGRFCKLFESVSVSENGEPRPVSCERQPEPAPAPAPTTGGEA